MISADLAGDLAGSALSAACAWALTTLQRTQRITIARVAVRIAVPPVRDDAGLYALAAVSTRLLDEDYLRHGILGGLNRASLDHLAGGLGLENRGLLREGVDRSEER